MNWVRRLLLCTYYSCALMARGVATRTFTAEQKRRRFFLRDNLTGLAQSPFRQAEAQNINPRAKQQVHKSVHSTTNGHGAPANSHQLLVVKLHRFTALSAQLPATAHTPFRSVGSSHTQLCIIQALELDASNRQCICVHIQQNQADGGTMLAQGKKTYLSLSSTMGTPQAKRGKCWTPILDTGRQQTNSG